MGRIWYGGGGIGTPGDPYGKLKEPEELGGLLGDQGVYIEDPDGERWAEGPCGVDDPGGGRERPVRFPAKEGNP